MKIKYIIFSVCFICLFTSFAVFSADKNSSDTKFDIPVIDGHNHINGLFRGRGRMEERYQDAVSETIRKMNQANIKTMIVMPPPFPAGHRGIYDVDKLIPYLKLYPGRFKVFGGGGTLNPMINEAVRIGKTTNEMKAQFKKAALKLVEEGVSGFGEMTAEHFSLGPNHNYQGAPPDHPLFLLLADIAAENNLPIDFHMEAITKEKPLPAHLKSPPNPKTLKPNIKAFETLIGHNPKAVIIWAHAGWDNSGNRSVRLMEELLKKYPNLYMSIKVRAVDSLPVNYPLDKEGDIKEEWLELFRKFPDRFFIGCDHFYTAPGGFRIGPDSMPETIQLFNRLPSDLQKKFGIENPSAIFKLTNP